MNTKKEKQFKIKLDESIRGEEIKIIGDTLFATKELFDYLTNNKLSGKAMICSPYHLYNEKTNKYDIDR